MQTSVSSNETLGRNASSSHLPASNASSSDQGNVVANHQAQDDDACEEKSNNVQVMVRIRPQSNQEKEGGHPVVITAPTDSVRCDRILLSNLYYLLQSICLSSLLSLLYCDLTSSNVFLMNGGFVILIDPFYDTIGDQSPSIQERFSQLG